MRLATCSMVFLGLAITGCAVQEADPQTSQVESLLVGKWTEHWDPMTATNASIWPNNIPGSNPPVAITNTYVLIKGAQDDSNNNHQFLGFVVWNGDTVGHVWRVTKNGVDGVSFNNIVNNAIVGQTNNGLNRDGGSTGDGGTGGIIPRPHPTGDELGISVNELNAAKTTAQGIRNAYVNFQSYQE